MNEELAKKLKRLNRNYCMGAIDSSELRAQAIDVFLRNPEVDPPLTLQQATEEVERWLKSLAE